MILGFGLLELIVRVLVAILVFFLVEWLLPFIFNGAGVPVPHPIVFIVAIICAILVFLTPRTVFGRRA